VRRVFGVAVERLHADTTSFAVHGQYASLPASTLAPVAEAEVATPPEAEAPAGEELPAVIEVTYGYSRDHREDLKQWVVALVTSGEGVPHFLQPLNGNASDKRALLEVVSTLTQQLQESGETPGIYVTDSGLYSTENLTTLNQAGVRWVSRVPGTSTVARALVAETPAAWQQSADGTRQWWSRVLDSPQGQERWIVVRTTEGEARARATCQRQAERDRASWEKRLWHLGNQLFACEADAQAALAKACQRRPTWLQVQSAVGAVAKYAKRGRPRKDAVPATQVWQIQASVTLDAEALEREALRRAAFIVGTNLLDAGAWPDEAIIALYREQTVAERGFAFLKDPLFLASSVFVKKPTRIMAIAFVMVLCLLVYKLAEVRLRQRLATTGQTVPDQVRKPTARPTMRWLFQCFEGIDLHHTLLPDGPRWTEVLRLTDLHRLVLRLLGPAYENCYLVSQQTVE
jgi:transposase